MSGRRPPDDGWPIPTPGDVLSYAYLWAREAEAGQEEGLKDRPVVVVLAVSGPGDRPELIVAPVTHSEPDSPASAVEMPAAVKRELRLDRAPSWIVTSEVNRFVWPGPDVRLVDATPFYGAVPDWLLRKVQDSFAALARRAGIRTTRRTE